MRFQISEIRDFSLIDVVNYPCAIIFLPYCNFNCFWCHNRDIAEGKIVKEVDENYLKLFLKNVKKVVDFVQISGGEPTINDQLLNLLKLIKGAGLKTSLCTNGSRPDVIRRLIKRNLVDHVSIDVKAELSCKRYKEIAGIKDCSIVPLIEESIEVLSSSDIIVEFRTTVIEGFHSISEIVNVYSEISKKLSNSNNKYLVLQQFLPPNGTIGLKSTSEKFLVELGKILKKKCGMKVYIRSISFTGPLH